MFLLLLISFVESLATSFMERGIYFFSTYMLDFSDGANLWLALAFGVAYVTGALCSHGFTKRLGERVVLIAAIGLQMLLHLALAIKPTWWSLFAWFPLLGLANGAKWPVVESFVSAGKAPRLQARAVGHFNVSWALPVPLAMIAFGPLIEWNTRSVFLLAAALNLACLLMCLRLPGSPEHLAVDDVSRPARRQIVRLKALLISGRWLMLASYTLMFLVVPLLPAVFHNLKVAERFSPACSGLMDVMRLAAFVLLGRWAGWHGRVGPLLAGVLAMPVSLFMMLFGPTLAVVLGGEILFGLAAGTIYYGALYYAMLVQNASVEGSGAHEGLIGSGFAIGPAIGLVSIAVRPLLGGNSVLAMLVSVGPILVLTSLAACLPLWRARRLLKGPMVQTAPAE